MDRSTGFRGYLPVASAGYHKCVTEPSVPAENSLPIVADTRPPAVVETALPVAETAAPHGETALPVLCGRNRRELETWLVGLKEPAYRGRQIAAWIYQRGARAFAEMTDLPAALRARLRESAVLGRAEVEARQRAVDGTVKLLLRFVDGRAVETVLLPYEDRTSVCISSQVGCPVGCVFCATAMLGFARNLTAGEMVDQVLAARSHAPGERVSHVVVMGMGEPLLNYDPLVTALRLLHEEVGLSYRHLTVSTAGHVPGMRRLAHEGLPVTLAVSLHAPNDALRERLIPMARKWNLEVVMDAAEEYSVQTGRRVTLEYLVLGGVNDGQDQAKELAKLARGSFHHVNLIPWNPATTLEHFRSPRPERLKKFREALEERGVTVTQRVERGQEIDAACGQLALVAAHGEERLVRIA